MFISKGLDINESNNKEMRQPLHCFLSSNTSMESKLSSLNTVSLLVNFGADILATDIYGETPLMIAIRQRFPFDTINVFIPVSDGNNAISAVNGEGFNAMRSALKEYHEKEVVSLVRLLLKAGVPVLEEEDGEEEKRGRKKEETSLIFLAIKNESTSETTLKQLLERTLISTFDEIRETLSERRFDFLNIRELMLNILLLVGEEVNKENIGLMHLIMKQLLDEYNIDINHHEDGKYLIHILMEKGKAAEEAFNYILSRDDIDLNVRRTSGETALQWFLNLGDYGFAEKLIDTFCDVTECNLTQIRLKFEFSSVFKKLFEAGKEISAQFLRSYPLEHQSEVYLLEKWLEPKRRQVPRLMKLAENKARSAVNRKDVLRVVKNLAFPGDSMVSSLLRITNESDQQLESEEEEEEEEILCDFSEESEDDSNV